MVLSPKGRRLVAIGLAGTGYLLAVKLLLEHGIQNAGGLGGIDALAYWLAAGTAWHAEPLYRTDIIAVFKYPPLIAQMLAPASLLPLPAFVWLWRLLELGALRVAAGSWVRAGIAMLVWPPIIAELDAGNIHLLMAAVVALAMRGTASLVAPSFLLKFASWPLAPIAWLRDRRGALIGLAVAAGAVAISWVLSPSAWRDYADFLATTRAPEGWYNLLSAVPVPVRFMVAAALGVAAIRFVRLAPLAVLLAYPIVWFHGLATLVAVITPLPASSPDERVAVGQGSAAAVPPSDP